MPTAGYSLSLSKKAPMISSYLPPAPILGFILPSARNASQIAPVYISSPLDKLGVNLNFELETNDISFIKCEGYFASHVFLGDIDKGIDCFTKRGIPETVINNFSKSIDVK